MLIKLTRVWRYQNDDENPSVNQKKNRQHNGQTKKYKQRSTKHTYKTKDRSTRTRLKTGGELRCSGRVSSFCSISGTRRVNLVKNLISGTYMLSTVKGCISNFSQNKDLMQVTIWIPNIIYSGFLFYVHYIIYMSYFP